MNDPLATRTAVYRLYDADVRLLYVGMAYSPVARWAAHARDKEWWCLVAHKTVEWYDDRPKAAAAEIAAIQAENPPWNTVHSPELVKVDGTWTKYLPGIPADLLARLEEERQEAEVVQATAAERLRFATAEFAEGRTPARRQRLHDAIVDALNAGVRPRDIDAIVPYDRVHIRRIAKAAGVPPRREPTVCRLDDKAQGKVA